MSWQHQRMPNGGQLQTLPEDGIVASSQPPGRVGRRWRGLLDQAPPDARDRVLRGRNFARRGRLRLLHIAPGTATASVVCEQDCRPTVRVRPFSKGEWATIVEELTQRLDLIASLLEGELPAALAKQLESRRIEVMPSWDELSFDCDCGDYIMPCTHVATLFHVLTDALDGDPFLLLTLRGRSRDHLLATLRSDWGDERPLVDASDDEEEAPPDGDWFAPSTGVPDFGCHWDDQPVQGAGLRALGPPPGQHNLLDTLLPLYEAGHKATRALIEAIPDREIPRRRLRHERMVAHLPPDGRELDGLGDLDPGPTEPITAPGVLQDGDLTERLVAVLDGAGGLDSRTLGERLGVSRTAVRSELVDMLELGLVYRTQGDGGVRWWLG